MLAMPSINLIKLHVPTITGPSLLWLELPNLPEEKLFSVIFFISTILKTIWDKRMAKSRISSYEVRTTLEAKCILLRKTRFVSRVSILEELLTNL
jgi:hypothetical protein